MDSERFPADLVVTVDDFKQSGWRDAIDEDARKNRHYHSAMSKAAREAEEAGNTAKCKVLWLLSDACSMMLKPESRSEPFQPFAVMQGRRSAIPEDFSAEDLAFFESILPEVDDYVIKSRLADLLWLVKSPKSFDHAKAAIDAYMQFPLGYDEILDGGREAWERAISLSRSLGKGVADKLENIRSALMAAFEAAQFEEGFYAIWLADLLDSAGTDRTSAEKIAQKLEDLSQQAIAVKDWRRGREYAESVAEWCKKLGDDQGVYDCHARIAEAYVSEAEQRISDETPSHLAAGQFFESAIKSYRNIPNHERERFNADERMAEIHRRMNESNKLAIGEMKAIEIPSPDISQPVEASQKHVKGKPFPEVLIRLAHIASVTNIEKLRESAEKGMQTSIISQLFGATHLAQDGRVAARSPGIDLGDKESEETKEAVAREMLKHYGIELGLTVSAQILPGLDIVTAEHRITERKLLTFCRASNFVPPGREVFWAKGLYAGFEGDFIVSTHLLIPQLEHVVRILMKQEGIKTTTLNSKGIETENGLSTLLDHPDIEKALEPDMHYEFKALLADSIGPNLRNECAHGLLESGDASSVYAVYLWWICLRLMINNVPWKGPEDLEE